MKEEYANKGDDNIEFIESLTNFVKQNMPKHEYLIFTTPEGSYTVHSPKCKHCGVVVGGAK